MNKEQARVWGEQNLEGARLRNFINALNNADSYMTKEAYDSHDNFQAIWRKCNASEEIKAFDDKYQQESKSLKAQIEALQNQYRELHETYNDKREQILSDLYKVEKETQEFKDLEENHEKIWIGIRAIREMRINEVVERYEKKVKVSA